MRKSMDIVAVERFIATVNREKLDYTKWQREHYDKIPPEEYKKAIYENYKKHPYEGKARVL